MILIKYYKNRVETKTKETISRFFHIFTRRWLKSNEKWEQLFRVSNVIKTIAFKQVKIKYLLDQTHVELYFFVFVSNCYQARLSSAIGYEDANTKEFELSKHNWYQWKKIRHWGYFYKDSTCPWVTTVPWPEYFFFFRRGALGATKKLVKLSLGEFRS